MPKAKDRRCDNRLTVIEAFHPQGRDTEIEAWATQVGHGIVRLRIIFCGRHKVDFAWLVSIDNARQASLYVHEDAPGVQVEIRSILELGPIPETAA